LHDFRATMRSHLAAMGVRYEVAERALNHRLGGLAEVYDRNDYAVERAEALAAWAQKLERLKMGARDNVVQLRKVV
jgi:integrase